MPTLRLSHKMILALERLYEANDQADFIAYKTAIALEARELVSMPTNPHQRTGGGMFPEYMATLTNSGRSWCERHFAKCGARKTNPRKAHTVGRQ